MLRALILLFMPLALQEPPDVIFIALLSVLRLGRSLLDLGCFLILGLCRVKKLSSKSLSFLLVHVYGDYCHLVFFTSFGHDNKTVVPASSISSSADSFMASMPAFFGHLQIPKSCQRCVAPLSLSLTASGWTRISLMEVMEEVDDECLSSLQVSDG